MGTGCEDMETGWEPGGNQEGTDGERKGNCREGADRKPRGETRRKREENEREPRRRHTCQPNDCTSWPPQSVWLGQFFAFTRLRSNEVRPGSDPVPTGSEPGTGTSGLLPRRAGNRQGARHELKNCVVDQGIEFRKNDSRRLVFQVPRTLNSDLLTTPNR